MCALEQTRPDGHGRARGLVSSRDSGRRVEARTFAPPEPLREVVSTFWVTQWDLRGQAPHVAELLADPCVTVAFEASADEPRASRRVGQVVGRAGRVVGVCTRLFRRELRGAGLIRAAKLRAGAARAVLGARSLAALTDRITPLPEVFPEDDALVPAVLEPAADQDALAALASWLQARCSAARDPQIQLATAIVEHISRAPELTSVERVAQAAGVSVRPLQRLFRDYVGASPKQVLRRFRLQEAAVRLEQDPRYALADLAAELGYADHAHLSRDFKAATGRSPASFARQA